MISLRHLPLTIRALFSSFLILIGIGYLTALSLLYLVDVEPHQRIGQSLVEGISEQYHGSPRGTRLEAALIGPMADRISVQDRNRVFQWIDGGAKAEEYPRVAPIFARNCTGCHSPQSGLSIPPLTSFDEIDKVVATDTGPSISQLARVSHIHLFGISIIFLLTGAIFSLSETVVWLRVTLVVLPYLTIVADIGSWWATKYLDPTFTYVVIAGGACMGLALAAQIFFSLWEMWSEPIKTGLARVAAGRRLRTSSNT